MRICGANSCPFPVFGTDKNTKIGYCQRHQWMRTDKKKKVVPGSKSKVYFDFGMASLFFSGSSIFFVSFFGVDGVDKRIF